MGPKAKFSSKTKREKNKLTNLICILYPFRIEICFFACSIIPLFVIFYSLRRDVAGNSNITITSRTFDMDSRRFYLDLKESGPNDSNDPNGPNGQNGQNRYIRMSETDCHGYQTNIFMAIPTAVEFQKYLESVVNFYKGLESNVIKNVPGNLKKIQIQKEDKKYSIGFKRKPEGPFLKIKEIKDGKRSRIYIPAKGMAEFNDHLDELIQENEIKENPGIITSKPKETINHVSENKIASKVLDRSSNQTYTILAKAFDMGSIFFDLGVRENTRGHHLTITEKGKDYKNNVFMTIPTALEFQKCLESMIKFYKGLNSTTDMINKFTDEPEDLQSEAIVREDKKYFIDLIRNSEGLFLQIKEITDGKSPGSKLYIPAEGMAEFHEHFNTLIQEYENRLTLKVDPVEPSSYFENHIASKTLDLGTNQSSFGTNRFILDVKENDQGVRVVKMKNTTKISKGGSINVIAISTASKICEHLESIINFYKSQKDFGANDFKNESGLLHESEMIVDEDMLYFHLFKNQNANHGISLRISSKEGRHQGRKWDTLFLTADSMEEFKRNLKELIEECGEIKSAEQGIGTKTN